MDEDYTWRVVGLNQQENFITACNVKKHPVNVQQLLILVCINTKMVCIYSYSVCYQHSSFYRAIQLQAKKCNW